MFKKWKFVISLSYLVFLAGDSVASLREDTDSATLSLYGPTNRGFSNIEPINLPNVEDGPSDNHFILSDHPASFLIDVGDGPIGDPRVVNKPVIRSALGFSSATVYGTICPAGSRCYHGGVHPIDHSLQPTIKTRISVFATARLTFDSFYEAARATSNTSFLDKLKLSLNPHDQTCSWGDKNAYYTREGQAGQGAINFCSRTVDTANIFDIASHETGHAILDALNGELLKKTPNHPHRAFHEAFGDLSSFYAAVRLARLTGRSYMVPDLLRNEESICFAPGLSGEGSCLLRDNSHGDCEAHANSSHFRSFFLGSMNRVYSELRGDSHGLWTIDFFQRLLVHTAVNVPKFDSLYTLGDYMINSVSSLSPNWQIGEFITRKMREELNLRFINLNRCKAA